MSYRKAFKKTSFLFLRPVIQTTLGAWSTYTYNPVTSRGARSAMKSKPLARILSAQSVTRSNKHGPKYSSWQTLQRFPSFLYRRHSSAGKISRLPFASLCRFTKVKQMFTRVGKWIHNGVALALGAVLPTNQLLMECLPLSICRRRPEKKNSNGIPWAFCIHLHQVPQAEILKMVGSRLVSSSKRHSISPKRADISPNYLVTSANSGCD